MYKGLILKYKTTYTIILFLMKYNRIISVVFWLYGYITYQHSKFKFTN